MSNIIVFGGTFNPIHTEHVEIIECLSKLPFADKVLVVPTHIPPHKEVLNLASDTDRMNMCRIATLNIPKVEISDCEIKRKGKSFTFYTVEALKEQYPKSEVYFVCGGDMAITIDSWHRFNELKKLCTFLVINRPGINNKALTEYLKPIIENGAKIQFIDCITRAVSSSDIRKDIKNDNDFGDVPKEVVKYIKENGLYGSK